MFYVYEWFIVKTGEIIYVGKGCRRRYKVTKHNKFFNEMIKRFECDSRIVKTFQNEKDAFLFEYERIKELKEKNQCVCNIYDGGCGGTTEWWTEDKKQWYSEHNVMKNEAQRKRMSANNPMKIKEIAKKTGLAKQRRVIINGIEYSGLIDASEKLNVASHTILLWCKRGYNTIGSPCRYADEQQKNYPISKITHPFAKSNKPVIIDGIRFETVKDGAKYIGVWSESLTRAIKHNRLCKGHICKYDNQKPSYTNFDNSSVKGSTTNE